MFERFTDRARRVVVLAQEEARLLDHGWIGTEHILLGLLCEGDGAGGKALAAAGITLEETRARVVEIIGAPQTKAPAAHIPFTARAKRALEMSLREALQLGENHIGTHHLLLGLIRDPAGLATQMLAEHEGRLERVRQAVIERAGDERPIVGAPSPASNAAVHRAVEQARRRAERAGRLPTAADLLAGLAGDEGTIAGQALAAAGTPDAGDGRIEIIGVLRVAARLANDLEGPEAEITTAHVLLSVLAGADAIDCLDAQRVRRAVFRLLADDVEDAT